MAKELRYGMVGGSVYAFIGEVHRKAIAFDPRAELVCGCFSNIPSENEDRQELRSERPHGQVPGQGRLCLRPHG